MSGTTSQAVVTSIITVTTNPSSPSVITTTKTVTSRTPAAQTPTSNYGYGDSSRPKGHSDNLIIFIVCLVAGIAILVFLCWACVLRSRRKMRREARELAALQQAAPQTAPQAVPPAELEGVALQEFYQPAARPEATRNHAMESNQMQEFYASREPASGSGMQVQSSAPVVQREEEPVLKPTGVNSRFR